MKIKIVRQYDTNMLKVGDLTRSNWTRYADRHGYDIQHIRLETLLPDANRKKLLAMSDQIVGSDGWLFWADADSAVVNPDVPLESFLDGIPVQYHLIFDDVANYGLSTGHFFARDSGLACEILDAAITCGNASDEANKEFTSLPSAKAADETTMKIFLKHFPRIQQHVTLMSIADFPATLAPDTFILHATQRSEEERIKLLSPYCQL